MSDEAERTLCQLPHVHVFRIPVRKSAEGHRASDWPKDPTWTGKLKIVAKGKVAAIILMDASNAVFAICQVTDDAAVERTLDSGRYFVLRITNAQGRHAFIGIAFNERNDAFDFNVALSEFKSELEREELANKWSTDAPVGPMKDMSLKEGEKIKIKINTKKKSTDEFDTDFAPTTSPAAKPSGGGLLAPPKGMLSPPAKAGFGATAPAPASASRTSSNGTTSSNVSSGFDDFGSFGSSDPFASTSPIKSASALAGSVFSFDADPFGSSFATTTPGKSTIAAPAASAGAFSSDPFGSFGDFNSFAPTAAASSPAPAASSVAPKKGDVANLLDF